MGTERTRDAEQTRTLWSSRMGWKVQFRFFNTLVSFYSCGLSCFFRRWKIDRRGDDIFYCQFQIRECSVWIWKGQEPTFTAYYYIKTRNAQHFFLDRLQELSHHQPYDSANLPTCSPVFGAPKRNQQFHFSVCNKIIIKCKVLNIGNTWFLCFRKRWIRARAAGCFSPRLSASFCYQRCKDRA